MDSTRRRAAQGRKAREPQTQSNRPEAEVSCKHDDVLREFWGDLKKAVGAWRVAPLLPFLTLVLQIPIYLQTLSPWFIALSILLWVFYAGYCGTERLWYLAIWRGQRLPDSIWRASWRYFARFFGLGVVMMALYLVVAVPLIALEVGYETVLASVLTTLVIDIWLTFMTPALAYSTDVVKEGMAIGWRMLKEHWRHCLPYVLAPPLATLVFLQQAEESIGTAPRIGLAIVGILTYLALKGATAAYYLRHHGASIPDDEIRVPMTTEGVTALQKIRDRVDR